MGSVEDSRQRERHYRQHCGLAAALDAVGERWTLLIIRELLLGPRRYNDLLADLPGIGTNLLADRLKKLCALGILHRRDVESGSGHVYELSEWGEELRAAVLPLARWGMSLLGEQASDAVVRPHWGFLAVQAMADASRIPPIAEEYEFRVADEVFHLRLHDGQTEAAKGPAQQPAMVATTDAATFVQIGAGLVTPFEAVASGRLTLSGPPSAVLRCSAVLGLVPSPFRP